MKIISNIKLTAVLLFIILAGCSSNIVGSKTFLAEPSATILITPGPTIQTTATWVSPLPKNEAEAEMIELLRDNGGCRLPCFLGIVPQKTTYEEFTSFVYQFVNIRRGGVLLSGNDSKTQIFFSKKYSEDPFASIQSMEVSMWSFDPEQGGLFYIFNDPLFAEYIQYYSLSSILTNYGPPSQTFVSLSPGEMGQDDIFHLFLDYPDLGWRVDYWMPYDQDGDVYVGCPSQAFIAFALWEPGDTAAAKETERWFTAFFSPPLDEATDLSIDEFYEQFKEPTNNQCLETPVDIWPWADQ